ncbi:hypothetical protein IKF21_02930 [Candidatus Saccharibacteria bacterium]|nr:hypothetical protein [Candidatus Saccharibacteria bacterium]
MDKNPFLDRLMKEESKDVVHSSAYAQAQNAEGIGAASTQSFATRRAIEQNRKMVRGYRDSKVVNEVGDGVVKSVKYDAEKDASQRAAIKERFGDRKNQQFGGSDKGTIGGGASTEKNQITPPTRRNPGLSR